MSSSGTVSSGRLARWPGYSSPPLFLHAARVARSEDGIIQSCDQARVHRRPRPRSPRNFQVLVDEARPFAFGQGSVSTSASGLIPAVQTNVLAGTVVPSLSVTSWSFTAVTLQFKRISTFSPARLRCTEVLSVSPSSWKIP